MKTDSMIRKIHLLEDIHAYPIFILDRTYYLSKYSSNEFLLPDDFFVEKVQVKLPTNFKVISIFEDTQAYVLIPYTHQEIGAIIIGPLLYHNIYYKKHIYDNSFLRTNYSIEDIDRMVVKMPTITNKIFPFIQLLYEILTDTELPHESIFESYANDTGLSDIMTALLDGTSAEIEVSNKIYPYLLEKELLYHIRHGEGERAIVTVNEILAYGDVVFLPIDDPKFPIYTFIAILVLIRATVIEDNVNVSAAFSLCTLYIKRMQQCTTYFSLFNIYLSAIQEFANLTKQKKNLTYPIWVRNAMEYVSLNLANPITLKDVSEYVNMKPSYVSVQFKKITSTGLIDYINQEKIKEAMYLLECTDTSLLEISLSLGYRSQAYFSKIFKEINDISPLAYRRKKQYSK